MYTAYHLFRIKLCYLLALQLLILLFVAACTGIPTAKGWPTGVVVDDTIYIGTMDGDFRALDLKTGDSKCKFEPGKNDQQNAFYGTPTIDKDTLFIGDYNGLLYALPLDCDNQRMWEPSDQQMVGNGHHIVGSPTVTDNTVLIGSSDGNLYAFNFTRDEKGVKFQGHRWDLPFHTNEQIWSTPTVANGIVYVGSLDHRLYAIDLETGKSIWESPFLAKGGITSKPFVANNQVHFGAFDGIFYTINANTGKEIRKFLGSGGWFWSDPVATEDTIYAATLNGHLYALDIETLEMRWAQPLITGGSIVGSPVIIGDRIAVPSSDKRVHMVRTSDGSEDHQCVIGTDLNASIVAHDGIIYLSATDHSVRALEVDSRGDPDEKWAHFSNRDIPVDRNKTPDC